MRSSPGVEVAELDYSEPVFLDSGKLQLRVSMTDAAPDDQVLEVVAAVYDAFATTHAEEEGDLDVRVDDDLLHLRAFRPTAATATVRTQASVALQAADRGRLRINVLANDVPADPGAQTFATVRLPAGSSREDILPTLDALAATGADATGVTWGVRSARRGAQRRLRISRRGRPPALGTTERDRGRRRLGDGRLPGVRDPPRRGVPAGGRDRGGRGGRRSRSTTRRRSDD